MPQDALTIRIAIFPLQLIYSLDPYVFLIKYFLCIFNLFTIPAGSLIVCWLPTQLVFCEWESVDEMLVSGWQSEQSKQWDIFIITW